jgi:hypothetical protein
VGGQKKEEDNIGKIVESVRQEVGGVKEGDT